MGENARAMIAVAAAVVLLAVPQEPPSAAVKHLTEHVEPLMDDGPELPELDPPVVGKWCVWEMIHVGGIRTACLMIRLSPQFAPDQRVKRCCTTLSIRPELLDRS